MDLKWLENCLRRWWWLAALYVGVAMLGSLVVSLLATPVYRASTTLIVTQGSASADATDYTSLLTDEHLANTYSRMLHGRPLRDSVIKSLGLQITAQELGKKIKTDVVDNTQLVTLNVDDSTPERATAIANELARQLIQALQDRQNARYASMRNSLSEQLNDTQLKIQHTETQLDQLDRIDEIYAEGDWEQRVRLEAALNQYEVNYATLLKSYEKVGLAEPHSVNDIVAAEAQTGDAPLSPRPLLDALMAALVGLVLAVAVGLVAERLDDTVKSLRDVKEAAGLLTLGVLARADDSVEARQAAPLRSWADLSNPRSSAAESFRTLRTNLEFTRLDHDLRTILVSSPGDGEGKSTVALGLATSMAQLGKRVVLVDANLRAPGLHEAVGFAQVRGLTTALLDAPGKSSLYLLETDNKGLLLMPGGHDRSGGPPNPGELLNSRRMAELVVELGAQADTVILDTASLQTGSDALLLAGLCDAVVLVARAGATRLGSLRAAKDSFTKAGATPVGVVLTWLPAVEVLRYHSQEGGNDQGTGRILSEVGERMGRLFDRFGWLPQLGIRTNDAD